METKDILLELRKKHDLSQDEMASQLFVDKTSGFTLGKW